MTCDSKRNILKTVSQKIALGERISDSDACELFHTIDILTLGQLANQIREKKHGNKSYYIVNRHIDYSNVCALKCKFCAFSKNKGEEGAFELNADEILEKVKEGLKVGITEIHMVGGLHPNHSWEYYKDLLIAIRNEAPDLHIKAFTAIEIRYFSKKYRLPEEEIIEQLIASGLGSVPGGGAEIFARQVRDEICGPKGPAEYWIRTHRRIHKRGLRSHATMLYGHTESFADRVDHMRRIRKLQDETGGFLSFIPLAFHAEETAYSHLTTPSLVDDLKTIAISRIYLDNIPHIKSYWIMSGVECAQFAQYWGADDFHGTVIEENITHMAGAKVPENLPAQQIRQLILETGREPVQRDSLHREVH